MMDMKGQQKIIDQMVDFQKKTVKNSLDTFELVNRRTGNMVELVLKQFIWFSEKWKQMIEDTSETYQNNCGRIYQTLGSQFEKVGNFVCMR